MSAHLRHSKKQCLSCLTMPHLSFWYESAWPAHDPTRNTVIITLPGYAAFTAHPCRAPRCLLIACLSLRLALATHEHHKPWMRTHLKCDVLLEDVWLEQLDDDADLRRQHANQHTLHRHHSGVNDSLIFTLSPCVRHGYNCCGRFEDHGMATIATVREKNFSRTTQTLTPCLWSYHRLSSTAWNLRHSRRGFNHACNDGKRWQQTAHVHCKVRCQRWPPGWRPPLCFHALRQLYGYPSTYDERGIVCMRSGKAKEGSRVIPLCLACLPWGNARRCSKRAASSTLPMRCMLNSLTTFTSQGTLTRDRGRTADHFFFSLAPFYEYPNAVPVRQTTEPHRTRSRPNHQTELTPGERRAAAMQQSRGRRSGEASLRQD